MENPSTFLHTRLKRRAIAAYDIVLHGATGFVGQLVADYLCRHSEGHRFSWAIAGRNPEKLEGIRKTIAARGTEPGVIVTQAAEQASVEAMVADSAVVLNVRIGRTNHDPVQSGKHVSPNRVERSTP